MQYGTEYEQHGGEIALDIRNFSQDFLTPLRSIHAVTGMNLTAKRGKITALVGESGSGKSSAALTVMGIQAKNAAIKSGEIYLAGKEVLSMPKKNQRFYISRHAGMIFQDPMDSLNPLFTVGQQLVEAVLVHEKMSKKQAADIAVEQLRSLSLPQPEELMKKYPFMLSGGMCQRVMIAIASISRPPLLIADEPTTALDVTVQDQILYQLKRMCKKEGCAILLITHDLSVVAEIADDVYIMRSGHIVESGTVEDIFYRPENLYTRQLLLAIL